MDPVTLAMAIGATFVGVLSKSGVFERWLDRRYRNRSLRLVKPDGREVQIEVQGKEGKLSDEEVRKVADALNIER
jgi:hypothetical protein